MKKAAMGVAAVLSCAAALVAFWAVSTPVSRKAPLAARAIEANSEQPTKKATRRRDYGFSRRLEGARPASPPTAEPLLGENSVEPGPSETDYEALRQERIAAMGKIVRSQPRDSTWAPLAEGNLEQAIRSAVPSAKVDAVECGTTLCVVEVTHDSLETLPSNSPETLREHGMQGFSGGENHNVGTHGEPPFRNVQFLVRDGVDPSSVLPP